MITRGGVVVTPLSEPTDYPRSARKAPWSTRGQTLIEDQTVYYSNAPPYGIRCTAGLSDCPGAAAREDRGKNVSNLGRILARLHLIRVLNRPLQGLEISCHYIIAMRCKGAEPVIIIHPAIIIQLRQRYAAFGTTPFLHICNDLYTVCLQLDNTSIISAAKCLNFDWVILILFRVV